MTVRCVFVALILLSFATSALAQADAQAPERPGRAFRGLFGGAGRDQSRRRSLDLSLTLLGGYDQSTVGAVPSSGGGPSDPRFAAGSRMASASANLLFEKAARNGNSIHAGGRTGFRYYPSLTELNAADYSAGAGVSLRASRRVDFNGNVDFGYQPFFSLMAIPVFPGTDLPAPTVDYAFAERPSIVYGVSLGSNVNIARRTHAVGGYTFHGFDFTRSGDQGQTRQQNLGVGLTWDLTRRTTIGGRYSFDHSSGLYTRLGATTQSQGAEFTYDYRRTLRSRRTVSVGLTAGYSGIRTRSSTFLTRSDNQVSAGLRAAVALGRSWTASGDYRRGVRRLPGLVDPVFSNDVQGSVAGLLGRRVDLTLTGRYSKGETSSSTWAGFDSGSGTAQLRWAISRTTALRGDYIYYRYSFPVGTQVPDGFDRRIGRHGARIGLDVWLPLYR